MNRRQFIQASFPATAVLAAPALAKPDFDWSAVRADFDFNPAFPQLSTVVSGLMPRTVRTELVRLMDQTNELRRASGSSELPPGRAALRTRVRRRAAAFIGAKPENIALTRNTTEGIATVLANLPLRPGDEILATTHEHLPYFGLLHQRQRRDGVIVRKVSVPTPASSSEAIVRAFADAMTPRTKLLLVTHVALTGQVFPVSEICAMARRAGAQTLIDGALGIAHVPVDTGAMDCDYYCGNFHKWAGGPPATGILYVRTDRVAALPPLFGHAIVSPQGAIEPLSDMPDMGKFSSIGRHPEYHWDALDVLFDWHDRIGAARREARLRELATSWLKQARDIAGFRAAAPPDLTASLVAWEIRGKSSPEIADRLWERHGLVLGLTDPLPGLFGESEARTLILTNTSLFTSDDDLSRLLDGIEDAARIG